MAGTKRRRGAGTEISLFPFLSILACVIGTLTLLLSGVSLGGMLDPKAANRFDYARIVGEREISAREVTELEKLIVQAAAIATRLEEALAELDRIKNRWLDFEDDAKSDERKVLDLTRQIQEHRARLAELERLLASLRTKHVDLAGRAAAKRREDEASRTTFVLRPQGSGRDLKPVFVECTSRGLLLRAEEAPPLQITVAEKDIAESTTFSKFLAEVGKASEKTVIFLIRPGGVHAFDKSLRPVLNSKTKYGYLPVPEGKTIDYSLFFPSKKGVQPESGK